MRGLLLVALLALPTTAQADPTPFPLGAGDDLGRRMYSRPLHRQNILARERGETTTRWIRPEPFDPRAWLEQRHEREGKLGTVLNR